MTSPDPSSGARSAGSREWGALTVLALPTTVVALDLGALLLALPQLSADLDADGTQQLWIVDSYGFLLAGFLITMGTLGDRIGRRRLLLWGAAGFAAASTAAAYAPTAEMLIAARAALGIAGATLMPSTLALISMLFERPSQRRAAVAVWAGCLMGGTALGPVLGGLLVEKFWWGAVFLIAVPVMALLLAVGPALLPESRDAGAGRLDLFSVVLSLTAVLSVVHGIKEIAAHGLGRGPALALAAGAAAGVVFVRRQRRTRDPLLDLGLLSLRPMRIALSVLLLGGALLSGMFLLVSQYLQVVEGLPPGPAGLWLVCAGGGVAAGALLAPALARRWSPPLVVAAGLGLSAAGFGSLAFVGGVGGVGSADGLAATAIALGVAHLGAGPMLALGTDVVLAIVPPHRAASAAALSETGAELGAALGLAGLGSLAAAVYRAHLLVPAGVPADLAAASTEHIAGAAAAAAHLPAATAASLDQAAKAAFSTALSVVAGASAGLFLLLALLAGWGLGDRRL